jgi:phage gp36-like protein
MPVVAGTRYAERTDLTALGLIGNALANVSTTIQDAALDAASALADSYLQSRYVLPLVTWGNDLKRIVAVIAAYDLITTRGYSPAGNADENVRQRYLDALKWLEAVRDSHGTPSQITDSSTAGGATGADGSVNVDGGSDFQFTTGSVRGWTSRGSDGGAW